MARPRKEGLDYFPHDTDAAGDEKVEPLHLLYGPDGYAFYFILLERIYRTPKAELDVSSPVLMGTLAAKVRISLDRFKEILETALTIGSFDRTRYEQDGVLTSNGIKKRAKKVRDERDRWRKNKETDKDPGEDGAEDNPDVNSLFSPEKTDLSMEKKKDISGENSGKSTQTCLLSLLEKEEGDKVSGNEGQETPESKGRKKKPEPEKIHYAEFVSMTEEEYTKLLNRFGEGDTAWMIDKLDNHKGAGGTKYKSDYRAILKWVVDALAEAKKKGLIPGQPRAPNIPLAYQSLREWAEREDDP